MEILPEPLSFEWDQGNLDKNFNKHKVRNQEIEEVFVSDPIFLFDDEKHSSQKEKRNMILGKTRESRKLIIIFTVRNDKIRVISARDMNKKERRRYEYQAKIDSNI